MGYGQGAAELKKVGVAEHMDLGGQTIATAA